MHVVLVQSYFVLFHWVSWIPHSGYFNLWYPGPQLIFGHHIPFRLRQHFSSVWSIIYDFIVHQSFLYSWEAYATRDGGVSRHSITLSSEYGLLGLIYWCDLEIIISYKRLKADDEFLIMQSLAVVFYSY